MATFRLAVAVAAVIFLITLSDASAQAPTMSPAEGPIMAMPPVTSPDCFSVLVNVSDCLTYVEVGSNLTKPDKGCCPELAGLVESNPICLCELIGKSDSFGVQLDLSKALNLPSICGVPTPPISMCSVVGIPIESPMSGDQTTPPAPGVQPPGESTTSNTNRKTWSIAGFGLAFFVSFLFPFF